VVVPGQSSLLQFDAAHSRGATEEVLVVRCPQPVTNERIPHASAIPELLRVDAQHTVIFGVAQQLDFSHLSQTGRVAYRPSARREAVSSRLHSPLCDVGDQARSAALRKGPLRELWPDFPGRLAVSFWHCVPLCYSCASERAISACEGLGDFLRVGAGDRHAKSPTGIRGT
jgi:hypothetical protein